MASCNPCCFSWLKKNASEPRSRGHRGKRNRKVAKPPSISSSDALVTSAAKASGSLDQATEVKVHAPATDDASLTPSGLIPSGLTAIGHNPTAVSCDGLAEGQVSQSSDTSAKPNQLSDGFIADTDARSSTALGPKHVHLDRLLGTWVDNDGFTLTFKVDERGCYTIEHRRKCGELLESGPVRGRQDFWKVWEPTSEDSIRDEGDFQRFAISQESDDVLICQLLETWGDWDHYQTYSRKPAQPLEQLGETAAAGSGDGQLSLVVGGTVRWNKFLHEKMFVRTPHPRMCDMVFGVSKVVFSRDGTQLFVGTHFARNRAEVLHSSGYVACFNADSGEVIWKWCPDELRSASPLKVGALSLSPCGYSLAAAFNQQRSHDCDGISMGGDGRGNPHLLYLDADTGSVVWKRALREAVQAIAHSPQSIFVAVTFQSDQSCSGGRVELWSTASAHMVWCCSIPSANMMNHSAALSFSPCGQTIYCAAGGCDHEYDDDYWFVVAIGTHSGQKAWKSYPVDDAEVFCDEIELSVNPHAQCITFACHLRSETTDTCQVLIGYLDPANGKLKKKAQASIPEGIRIVKVEYLSDTHAILAVDTWSGVKACRISLHGPPRGWDEGFKRTCTRYWPAQADTDILWTCMISNNDNVYGFAFKPCLVDPSQFVELTRPSTSDDANLARIEPKAKPKRKSHNQRRREKQWKKSVQIPTPASYD
eukprot:TRINITY_DN26712_c0_g1_i1.p1 TRINITY_DN26712_c0_g1~~TRINITY_DN26712_c0_g1_i1.p1  ORF type:complete len:706 (-),score=70.90 TRINITY_DN26712_c0_g1_i1:317-2434(-)